MLNNAPKMVYCSTKTTFSTKFWGGEDIEDILGIADEFQFDAVEKAINYVADIYGYSKTDFVIHEKEKYNEETGAYETVVALEYDFWVVIYEPNENCAIVFNDVTGSLSERYTLIEEEVEWFD